MNLPSLRALDAVLATGGFGRAAERLNLSQPAVSAQILALERQYGVELFRRGPAGAAPTELGQELAPHVRRILGLLRDLEHLLLQARNLDRGRLTLAADGPFAAMPLLRRLRDRHPAIASSLTTGNTAATLVAVRSGIADAGVVSLIEAAPDLARVRLESDRVVLLLPVSHPWSARATVSMAEMAGIAVVAREEGSATFRLFAAACARSGVRPELALRLGSREAMREAVAAGFGVGAVFEREAGTDPRLTTVALDGSDLTADTCLVALPERAELGVVRALFQLAEEAQAALRTS
ncbi:MAG TPA: LysR substrate-binding domain-containing protein [Geminicoccus sp.]|jgi:aminoethylphosphonate catabolism LysR family transcriptional regulator|uniref:LysR substrate-binding domain-containing protein n=1 Tax=Geminicoccus sp. TaxID=2024832 RepID=UPI002E34D5CF|nr:LysR substrate-binding domain-containing protein [Geminicoccus sp.]HEX2525133.1 LysR substrate-binding domain-containing protein [Geminicoccus sp.]